MTNSHSTKAADAKVELVKRLRNAAKLAEKKYVSNSSELFNLAADALAAPQEDAHDQD